MPARHLARHTTAAVVLAALASACSPDSPDSPPPRADNSPFAYTSTDVPMAIPDNNPTGVTSYLTVSAAPTSIAKVTVKLSIAHSYDDDLYVTLFSPSGTQVALSWNNGGSGANYTNTVFDDSASTYVYNGAAPFTGTYKPQWPPLASTERTRTGRGGSRWSTAGRTTPGHFRVGASRSGDAADELRS